MELVLLQTTANALLTTWAQIAKQPRAMVSSVMKLELVQVTVNAQALTLVSAIQDTLEMIVLYSLAME